MNRSSNTTSHIRFVFFLMGLALVFAWSSNAHADTTSQVSIAQTGQVMVRDAIVTSVSGYIITAESMWGAATISWKLQTTGSTSFVPRLGSKAVLKAIKPGDHVNFSGTLDRSAASFTADVTYLSDSTLLNENASIAGQVMSVFPNSGTILVDTDSGTTTVSIGSGTILTRGGARATLDDISTGDVIKAWGALNSRTNVLDADKVSVSVKKVATSGGSGFNLFSKIVAWFEGSRGSLTVRDK